MSEIRWLRCKLRDHVQARTLRKLFGSAYLSGLSGWSGVVGGLLVVSVVERPLSFSGPEWSVGGYEVTTWEAQWDSGCPLRQLLDRMQAKARAELLS